MVTELVLTPYRLHWLRSKVSYLHRDLDHQVHNSHLSMESDLNCSSICLSIPQHLISCQTRRTFAVLCRRVAMVHPSTPFQDRLPVLWNLQVEPSVSLRQARFDML